MVLVYCEAEKSWKFLLASLSINADAATLEKLRQAFGEKNVKVVEKAIEK